MYIPIIIYFQFNTLIEFLQENKKNKSMHAMGRRWYQKGNVQYMVNIHVCGGGTASSVVAYIAMYTLFNHPVIQGELEISN